METYSDILDEFIRFPILAEVFWLEIAQDLHAMTACQPGIKRSSGEATRTKTARTIFTTAQLVLLLLCLLLLLLQLLQLILLVRVLPAWD